MMTSPDWLQDCVAVAQQAARNAAEVLERWRSCFRVREKGRFDMVTDADVESQQVIRATIRQRFPEHIFLGEEDAAASPSAGAMGAWVTGRPGPEAPPTWIIDPLDGTTNYIHDCPLYCISIGLQVAGELVVGIVYDPSRQEMFHAAQGQGAWLNGRRLQTSKVDRLEDALLATGFPPDMRGHEQTLDWWRYFSFRAHSLRRTGTTALNLAYVACGRFDGYWAFDNHVWDVAAAAVLVREAGGTISNVDGTTFDPYTADALATNGPLHSSMLACFRDG